MEINNYLENYQLVAYQIFKNSLKNKTFFHAYLLSGPFGTPLLSFAKFLAKSILCDSPTPFACETCNTCLRVEKETYGDLVILDAGTSSIKIDDLRNKVYHFFTKSGQERKGIKIYIINEIENLSNDIINMLLKFLEEPSDDTYAIFTTHNELKVLPTILSRAEIVRFSALNKSFLIEESLKLGVKRRDAEIFSYFYNDATKILEATKDKTLVSINKVVFEIFNSLDDKDNLRFLIENKLLKLTNTKVLARYLLDLISLFFKESLSFSLKENTLLHEYDIILKDIEETYLNINKKVVELMSKRNEINYNLNINLLLLHVLSEVFEV